MFIVAGLGNPAENLKKTRHNIGFRALDFLAEKNNFIDFNFSKKYNALASEGFLSCEKTILLKPQTFMNASGLAIKAAIKSFKLKPKNLIVVHDDADLPTGRLRISKDRGSGGHKGIESIMQEIKSKDFIRIRIGIASLQTQKQRPAPDLKKFVLKNFTEEEEKALAAVIDKAAEAIEAIVKEGTDAAMNKHN